MNLPSAIPNPSRARSARTLKFTPIFSVILIMLLGAAAWLAWQALRPIQLPGTPATAEAIEAQWGIRITHIAVLADGGLIDFRFQVIDPDKAAPLFSLDNRPIMIVEKTGQVVDGLYHPPHGHDIVAGQSQYFIYNNRGGAIQPGILVSVVLGNLRLEHIIAQ